MRGIRAAGGALFLLGLLTLPGCATIVDWSGNGEERYRMFGGTRLIAERPGYMREMYGCLDAETQDNLLYAPAYLGLVVAAMGDGILTMLADLFLAPFSCFYHSECYSMFCNCCEGGEADP